MIAHRTVVFAIFTPVTTLEFMVVGSMKLLVLIRPTNGLMRAPHFTVADLIRKAGLTVIHSVPSAGRGAERCILARRLVSGNE